MAAGKINLQANDGFVLGLYAPDGMGANTDIVPASVNGDATKVFKVADAVNADESLAKGQLLTEMKLVDGAGSGLDADLLDGLDSTQFSKVVSLPNNSGVIKWEKIAYLRGQAASAGGEISFDVYGSGDLGGIGRQTLHIDAQQRGANNIKVNVFSLENGNVTANRVTIGYVQVGTYDFDIYIRRGIYNSCIVVGQNSTFNGTFVNNPTSLTTEPSGIVYVTENKIWHTGNDGSGSGLDADLLRGLPADFTASKATNGYQKLPSGLIIQWGISPNIGIGMAQTITFPIAFPNACLNAQASDQGSGEDTSVGVFSLSSSSIGLVVPVNDTAARTYYWMAIGY